MTCSVISVGNLDEAIEVVQELDNTDRGIDEILADIRLKTSSRPKRTCAPSTRAVEAAALPTDSDATDVNDFSDVYVQ